MDNRSQPRILAPVANPAPDLSTKKQELIEKARKKTIILKKLLEQYTVLEDPIYKKDIHNVWYDGCFDEDQIGSLNVEELQEGLEKVNRSIVRLESALEDYPKKVDAFTQLQKHTFSFLKAYAKNLNERPINEEIQTINSHLSAIEELCDDEGDKDIISYAIIVDAYKDHVDFLKDAVERLETQNFLRYMEMLIAQRKGLLEHMEKHGFPTRKTGQEIEDFIEQLKKEEAPKLSLSYIQELREAYKNIIAEDFQHFLKIKKKNEKPLFVASSSYSPGLYQQNKKPYENNSGLKSALKKTTPHNDGIVYLQKSLGPT